MMLPNWLWKEKNNHLTEKEHIDQDDIVLVT